jgi:hypothetical protein
MHTTPTTLDRFAEAAESFCAWCTAQSETPALEARRAIRHLSTLYARALELRIPADPDPAIEGHRTDDETWRAIFERCSVLPLNYYGEVLDPLTVPPESPVTGDLADDIADMHRDIECGLSLYRDGHRTEAEWKWRHSFESHWGLHACSALRALHCWLTATDEW